jgi:hypothetical protein
MIKFILIMVGLFAIVYNPFLIAIAGAVYFTWLFLKKPNSFTAVVDTQPEESKDHKDFMTSEERTEKEMSNIKFKEGFQDDPRWQAKARSVGIQVEKAQEIEEARMRELGQNIKSMG